jgi:ABC-2 type transport system permease protein
VLGLRGHVGRTFGNILPSALSWGLGLGIFGLVVAGSGESFVQQLGNSPDFARILGTVFPGIDIGAVGGFLQLVFIEFGLVLAGLAAATLVGSWASDETSGRLEFLLATPLSRRRWVAAGGIGLLGGVVVIVAMAAAGIAIGASITGGDIVTPIVGSLVLGVYAVALVGIGVAVGGVVGTRFAGVAVALVTLVTWALGIFGPALGLPDAINQLALTLHYGFPMLGVWDPAGVVASLVLAVGGVALGAWGLQRRDLDR